jgi:hypothetical protein
MDYGGLRILRRFTDFTAVYGFYGGLRQNYGELESLCNLFTAVLQSIAISCNQKAINYGVTVP